MNQENLRILQVPRSFAVDAVASVSQETNRRPDVYIFTLNNNGRICRTNGTPIENEITADSELGQRELKAFLTIQEWFNHSDSGITLWFSPPYPGIYPVSKVVISQILYDGDFQKMLLNRAILLDVDAKDLLSIANCLSLDSSIISPEDLRETPLFKKEEDLQTILDLLRIKDDKQVAMIISGQDVHEQAVVIGQLSNYQIATHRTDYWGIRRYAEENDLIGDKSESCPTAAKETAFSAFSKSYEFTPGVCRICGQSTEVGPCRICRHCEKNL